MARMMRGFASDWLCAGASGAAASIAKMKSIDFIFISLSGLSADPTNQSTALSQNQVYSCSYSCQQYENAIVLLAKRRIFSMRNENPNDPASEREALSLFKPSAVSAVVESASQ